MNPTVSNGRYLRCFLRITIIQMVKNDRVVSASKCTILYRTSNTINKPSIWATCDKVYSLSSNTAALYYYLIVWISFSILKILYTTSNVTTGTQHLWFWPSTCNFYLTASRQYTLCNSKLHIRNVFQIWHLSARK